MSHIQDQQQNTMKIGIIEILVNSTIAKQEETETTLQSWYLLCHFSIIPQTKQWSQESRMSSNHTKYNHNETDYYLRLLLLLLWFQSTPRDSSVSQRFSKVQDDYLHSFQKSTNSSFYPLPFAYYHWNNQQ